MNRAVLGLTAAALTVAVSGVLIDRLVFRAEWWQVEHELAAAPAVPLADLGPAPGPLVPTWDRATKVHRGRLAGYDKVAYELVRGQVVAASGRGIEVRDARTGADRWRYRRAGWVLLGWAVTGDQLVAYLERPGRRSAGQMIAFDVARGRQLWRRAGERPALIARANLRWPAGTGRVLSTDPDRRWLYGRSASTGARVWTARLPMGCRLSEAAGNAAASDAELAALTMDCAGEDRPSRSPWTDYRTLAVDTGTGRIDWIRPTGSTDPPEISVRAGVTVVSDDSTVRAYRRDGRELVVRRGEDLCGEGPCPAAVSDGRLVLATAQGRRLEAVEIFSGRRIWSRTAPGYLTFTTAGGWLYGLRPRLGGNLLPAAVDVIDPADGSVTTSPTTLAVDPGLDSVRPWLAAAGGLLFVAVPEASPRPTGGARVAALRGGPSGPGPVELGGVAAADWPDACRLLHTPDLAAARLAGYVAHPERVKVGPVRLPRPVGCTYGPERSERRDPDARGLTVSVKWVAADGAAAARLLEALCATQSQVRPRSDLGGDEAYELGPTGGSIAVRVDRFIIAVNASPTAGTATRLARAAATRLRADFADARTSTSQVPS